MIKRFLTLIPAMTMCAACASVVSGQPAADSAEPHLPPRPRDLKVNGLDPCSTLTTVQLKSLGVQFYAADQADERRGPSCNWTHSPTEPVESYTVAINTDGGVELAFGQPRLDVITVAGFGAVETPGVLSKGDDDCFVHVDVAPSQAVQVGYFYDGSTVSMTHEIACQKARNAAELAMQTILAKVAR